MRVLPFFRAVHPIAAQYLEAACASRGLSISPHLRQEATAEVARAASNIVAHTLITDFHEYRTRLGTPILPGETWRHDRYLQRITDAGGLLAYLSSWPAALTTFTKVLRSNSTACAGVLEHLLRDERLLRERWGLRLDGRTSVEATDSDPHNGQQRVFIISSGGRRVVYKPRSLAPEAALYDAMERFNARCGEPRFATLPLVDLHDHGWMTHVTPGSPATAQGLESYAVRMGNLAALAWVLHLSDLHAQNVMASGGWPIVVDAETVFQPRLSTSLDGGLGGDRSFSVLDTLLLPRPVRAGEHVHDMSAIGATSAALTGGRWMAAREVDSDRVTLDWEPATCPIFGVPSLDRRLGSKLVDELLRSGFVHTMEQLLTQWDIVDSLAEQIRSGGIARRVVLRPSSVYERHLHRATSADFSVSLDERRKQLVPGLPAREDGFSDLRRRLTEEEVRSLEGGDIPYATLSALGGNVRMCSGVELEGIVAHDPLEAFERPTAERITQEVSLVGSAVAVGAVTQGWRQVERAQSPAASTVEQAVEVLLSGLWESGLLPEDPEGPWFGIHYDPPRLVRQDSTLYAGAPGIACLLAACTYLDGPRARKCEQLLSAFVGRTEGGFAAGLKGRIGALDGTAGVLLAMRFVDRLLPGLVPPQILARLAGEVAGSIDEHLNSGDPIRLDLTNGLAGALIAIAGFKIPDHRAVTRRALETLVSSQLRGGSWPDEEGRSLCGAAHGASGILLALAQHQDDRGALAPPVARALQFEDANFDAQAWAWVDRRADPPSDPPAAWCHGAVGIMRSRWALAGSIDSSPDTQRALASIDHWRASNDRLCCGMTGQLDAAVSLHQDFRIDDLRESLLNDLLGRASQPRRLRLEASLRGLTWPALPPGLFRGVSGVAYVLMRAAHPELPSPLSVLEPNLVADREDLCGVPAVAGSREVGARASIG